LALTKKLIRIPSVLGEESQIGEFIASQLGKDAFLQDVPGFPPNVIAERICDEDAPTIILNGHMDTIRPLSGWSTDPFKPSLKGNILHGLGASDMKGGLAVMMNAFLKARNDRINLVFVSTVDEEGVCTGAFEFIKEYEGDLCIVGEPSAERIILGARGRYVLDITVRGQASHGAKPELGTNPIEDMAYVIQALKKVRIRRHRFMGIGSITPLEIRGGVGTLTVPERCRMQVDRHTVPGETQGLIKNDFESVLKRLPVESDVQMSFAKRSTPFLEPYHTDRRSKLVRKFIQSFRSHYGKEPDIGSASSVGDYNVFGSRMPTVVFGPMGKGSHSTLERLDVRSLYRCERFLTGFLESL
jgi:acetylornithine deacetylase/succinyl-diaminopimelate desuccinylase-like protein